MLYAFATHTIAQQRSDGRPHWPAPPRTGPNWKWTELAPGTRAIKRRAGHEDWTQGRAARLWRRPAIQDAALVLLGCTWTHREALRRADEDNCGRGLSSHVAPESATPRPVTVAIAACCCNCNRAGRSGHWLREQRFALTATCLTLCGSLSFSSLAASSSFSFARFASTLPTLTELSRRHSSNNGRLFICSSTCRDCPITSDLPTIGRLSDGGAQEEDAPPRRTHTHTHALANMHVRVALISSGASLQWASRHSFHGGAA